MSSQSSRLFLIVISVVSLQLIAPQLITLAGLQEEIPRSIKSDDFTKNRPRSKRRGTPGGSHLYRLASSPRTRPAGESSFGTLQLGLTIWKEQPQSRQLERISKRVEADNKFREGDLLRLSIESPRAGYLYVIDRDWFTDGSGGETNLIFPVRGEDNRLVAGKLIDIPAEKETPFKATPKSNQVGEMLIIIVTRSPLRLPLSKDPLPITSTQLSDWEKRWSAMPDRYEMENGAGLTRTSQEQRAAEPKGTRQLTRDDPGPQTIYRLSPKTREAFLFNVLLSYVR
jgi:Domain of unknown function (DUF4384)